MADFFTYLDMSNSIFAMSLILVGTIGNSLGALLCLKKDLRKTPTFVFNFFILVNDVVCLYFWNIDTVIYAFVGIWLESINVIICQLMTMLQCTTLNWVSWLLVLMSIEKYVSIKSNKWRRYFDSKKAITLSLTIGLVMFIIHLGFVINLHQITFKNQTNCLLTHEFNIWYRSNLYVYFVIPFIFICSSNALLIYEIIKHESMSVQAMNLVDRSAKSRNATFSVLWVTTSFLLLTLPNNICTYFNEHFQNLAHGLSIVNLTTNLQFTFHAFNFLIIFLANKQFQRCVKSMKSSLVRKSNKIQSSTKSPQKRDETP